MILLFVSLDANGLSDCATGISPMWIVVRKMREVMVKTQKYILGGAKAKPTTHSS